MPDQEARPEMKPASTSAGQEPESDSLALDANPEISAGIGEGVPVGTIGVGIRSTFG